MIFTLRDLAVTLAVILAMMVIGVGGVVGAYLIIHDRITGGRPAKPQRKLRSARTRADAARAGSARPSAEEASPCSL